MMPRKRIAVPRYLAPMAKKIRDIETAIHKSLLIETPDVFPELLPDGRIMPRVKGLGVVMVPAVGFAPGPPPGGTPGGLFTEFYCNSFGSNLNAGSSESSGPIYSCTNGNWVQATTYTPADGSNPVAAGVAVGMFASIYPNAATETTYVARITGVVNATNGAISLRSVSPGYCGAAPGSGNGTVSIRVGGAWKGMSGSRTFPFAPNGIDGAGGPGIANLTNLNGDEVRLNIKNDQTYVTSTAINESMQNAVIQGYGSTKGDGGQATIQLSTTANPQVVFQGSPGVTLIDLIWQNTATTGTSTLLRISGGGGMLVRNTMRNGRGTGVEMINAVAYQCLVDSCNQGNLSTGAGFYCLQSPVGCFYCWVTNLGLPAGTGDAYRLATGTQMFIINCIASKCGRGVLGSSSSSGGTIFVQNCDFYRIAGDCIAVAQNGKQGFHIMLNNNFLLSGRGIDNTSGSPGISYNNGYGKQSMGNTNDDVLGPIMEVGKVTYPDGANPWKDPDNGDFSSAGLAAARAAGRGAFGGPTIGYPDIGAAQHA